MHEREIGSTHLSPGAWRVQVRDKGNASQDKGNASQICNCNTWGEDYALFDKRSPGAGAHDPRVGLGLEPTKGRLQQARAHRTTATDRAVGSEDTYP